MWTACDVAVDMLSWVSSLPKTIISELLRFPFISRRYLLQVLLSLDAADTTCPGNAVQNRGRKTTQCPSFLSKKSLACCWQGKGCCQPNILERKYQYAEASGEGGISYTMDSISPKKKSHHLTGVLVGWSMDCQTQLSGKENNKQTFVKS